VCEGYTDERGQAELFDLPAGGYSFALPLSKVRSSVAVVAGTTESFTVELEAGLHLRGLVVDFGQIFVPGAIVAVDSFRDAPVEVQADAAGRFELRDVQTPVLVRARAPGRLPSIARVVDGLRGSTVDLRLLLGPEALAFRGRVLDSHRGGAGGADVWVC
jgi:hypothetical protein